MVLLDIIILVILAYALFVGFRSGLVMQLTTLVAVAAGIWGAIHFSDRFELWLTDQVELGTMTGAVSFALTFLLILIAVNLIGRLVTKTLDMAMLSMPNRLGGALLSAAKYALIISALIQSMDGAGITPYILPEQKRAESMLYEPIRTIAPTVIPAIKESPWVQRSWDQLKEGVTEDQE